MRIRTSTSRSRLLIAVYVTAMRRVLALLTAIAPGGRRVHLQLGRPRCPDPRRRPGARRCGQAPLRGAACCSSSRPTSARSCSAPCSRSAPCPRSASSPNPQPSATRPASRRPTPTVATRSSSKGSDTQGTFGTESTLNVVFSGPPRPGQHHAQLHRRGHRRSPSRTPACGGRKPRLSSGAGQIGLSWSPLPPSAGGDPAYSALVFDGTAPAAAVVASPPPASEASIDPRILEDRSGTVAVGAGAALRAASGAGDLHASFLSPRLPVDANAGAPPSRAVRARR